MNLADEFTAQDKELIVTLAERLTGASPQTQPKIESSLVNIKRRMEATGSKSLLTYLAKVETSADELAHFISAVTIHTTSWFRESPHFDRLQHLVTALIPAFQTGKRTQPVKILSAGCSTGEEAYTMALVLEDLRQKYPGFEYSIEGWDIDPVSVRKANRAIYNSAGQCEIGAAYHRYLLAGSGPTKGFFTLSREIRSRCKFYRRSLTTPKQAAEHEYDIIFCRNVLIYFNSKTVREIVANLLSFLVSGGHLCLGHSESIEFESFGLSALGNTTYKKLSTVAKKNQPGKANLANAARPTKSILDGKQTLVRPNIILIGASTGGTEVLVQLLHNMPQPCPPIVVVQHIAQAFAKPFAERLASSAGLSLGVPNAGSVLQPNHLYMAWDDYHIGVRKRGQYYYLEHNHDGLIHGVRPSVDFLFHSATRPDNHSLIAAVILTGMGKDGAQGLAELRRAGAMTFVQDQASSTVFGMPREAIMLGAAGFVGGPNAIRSQLMQALQAQKLNQTA